MTADRDLSAKEFAAETRAFADGADPGSNRTRLRERLHDLADALDAASARAAAAEARAERYAEALRNITDLGPYADGRWTVPAFNDALAATRAALEET